MAFSDHEREELAERPRVSLLAVLALAAGLISAAAIWAPIAVLLALVAAALGALALRQIAASDPPRAGRAAAVAGLCLGLLFASWGLARQQLHGWLLGSQAQRFADQWFALVREGRLREAHELMRSQEGRAAPGSDLETIYADDEERRTSLKATFADQPLRSVVEARPAATLTCEGVAELVSDRLLGIRKEVVSLRYVLRDGEAPPVPLLVDLARTTARGMGEARWDVQGVRFPK